jgi:acyl-CoA reductase-like NAD-dependent aldehyde dehydrogenase
VELEARLQSFVAGRNETMTKAETSIKVRHEPMRIAGKLVDADETLNVHYPYTDAVVGTVPAGTAEHARKAFEIAANYTPKLTRYERQKILLKTAELLNTRKEEISDLVTSELGISKQDRSTRSAAPSTSTPSPARW